jgi:hypothetical protein
MSMLCSALAITVGSPAAWAGSKTATVEFGTLESVARAANGDTIAVSGAGTFSLQTKGVSGEAELIEAAFGSIPRTFTHRDAHGHVLAEGTWELSAVLSYRSFGPATDEQVAELGLPDGSEGGKLMVKVALLVSGAHVHDGILTIVCELGQPPKHSEEATLLLVQGTSLNFNDVVSGDNIFIRH